MHVFSMWVGKKEQGGDVFSWVPRGYQCVQFGRGPDMIFICEVHLAKKIKRKPSYIILERKNS